MDLPLLAIVRDPLVIEPLIEQLEAKAGSARGGDGAIAVFLGIVRNHNHGRRVQYLEYEAYEPLARNVFAQIDAEMRERWPAVRLALHHRIGRVDIGEASVAIVAASPHRAEAFAACRYVIERVKQIAPVWKHEFFEGGDVWIEGAAADPLDHAARAAAERVACA